MFFSIKFYQKHLKELKKHPQILYKLTSKLYIFSNQSFADLITQGKENGIAKVTDLNIHKKLKIDIELELYKFRLSQDIRCYATKNIVSSTEAGVLDLVFIDVNHDI